jgi:hypothetical protein
MKSVALLLFAAACGGGQQPMLANAPHPNNAAMAGGAAAAAAAITLASPDSAAQKPEKNQNENKQAVDVKENVPPDVFDRLDHPANGSGAGSSSAQPATKKKSGPTPKLPSPREAVDPDQR